VVEVLGDLELYGTTEAPLLWEVVVEKEVEILLFTLGAMVVLEAVEMEQVV
jgi:hypothetical protein